MFIKIGGEPQWVTIDNGVYFPQLHEGQKDETPLLVALGVYEKGAKDVLGVVVAGAETADA